MPFIVTFPFWVGRVGPEQGGAISVYLFPVRPLAPFVPCQNLTASRPDASNVNPPFGTATYFSPLLFLLWSAGPARSKVAR